MIRPPSELLRAVELSNSITAAINPQTIGTKYAEILAGVNSDTIHATVLSYLVLVGDALGYRAYVDAPHFDAVDSRLLGIGHKRPDALWLERNSEHSVVIAEFEQYKNAGLLADKARNLVLMDAARPFPPALLVLVAWASIPVDWSEVREVLANGGKFGPGAQERLVARAPCLLAELKVTRGDMIRARTLVPTGLLYRGLDYVSEVKRDKSTPQH